MVCTVLIALIFSAVCLVNNARLANQARHIGDQKDIVLVYPDEIKIDGDQFNFVSKNNHESQRSVYYGYFNSVEELRFVQKSTQPLLFKFSGEYSQINSTTNFNQFDAKKFYHHQKIVRQYKVKEILAIKRQKDLSINGFVHQIRSRFNQHCATLPKLFRLYAESLVSGVRENDFYTAMTGVTDLGLLHVFSISGMHVVYFLGLIEKIFSILGLPSKLKLWLKLHLLGCYYIFSGGAISLFRSMISGAIGLISKEYQLSLSGIDIWSAVLIANLFLYPEALFMLGVQLSYGLALGLILCRNYSYWRQTLLLNIFTIPFLIYHVFEWHPLSLLINIIFLPIFPAVIFPIIIVGLIDSSLFRIFLPMVELGLTYFNNLLNWLGNLPGMITFGRPNIWIVTILICLSIFVMIEKKSKPVGNFKISLIWMSVFFGTFLVIHFPAHGEVTMFDIGQGDSFLLREPFNRKVTIIDTGGHLAFGQKWVKRQPKYFSVRTSINYLKSIGISKIDYLCVSHQDADHCGDIPAFLKELNVKKVIFPEGMQFNSSFMKKVENRGQQTQLIPVTDNTQVNGLPLQILHPFVSGKGENKDSMVLYTK